MKKLGMDEPEMVKILQEKIYEDDKAGLNVWGGKYGKGEKPPSIIPKYWEKW